MQPADRLNKKRSRLVRTGIGLLLGGLAAAIPGCGGADHKGPGNVAEPEAKHHAYGVKFLVGTGKATRLASNGPAVAEFSAQHRADSLPKDAKSQAPGLRTLATVETPTGSFTEGSNPNSPESWYLLKGALIECGMVGPRLDVDNPVAFSPLVSTPWPLEDPGNGFPEPTGAFFLFKQLPPTCDARLIYQQALVCAAEKLAEVASASRPIVWKLEGYDEIPEIAPGGPWTIPPQSAESRFIARDLAALSLSQAAWLDMGTINYEGFELDDTGGQVGTIKRNCTTLYANLASGGAASNSLLNAVFGVNGVGFKLPGETPLANKPYAKSMLTHSGQELEFATQVPQFAQDHLQLKAHVLRAGARILPNLLKEGVYADLAGAASRKAHSSTVEEGMGEFWGRNPSGPFNPFDFSHKYNSLSHAVRTVSGRWSTGFWVGDNTTDGSMVFDIRFNALTCPEINALDALSTVGIGQSYDVRSQASQLRSEAQAKALVALSATGMVFKSNVIEGNTAAADIRDNIIRQTVHSKAMAAGAASDADFEATPSGQETLRMLDGVGDADLIFAAREVNNRFRVLMDSGADTFPPAKELGANLIPNSQRVTGLKGSPIIFKDAVPTQQIVADILATVGGVQNVAECLGTVNTNNASDPVRADWLFNYATQDSFALAQTFYSRLVAIREKSANLGGNLHELASAGAAETRAFSGEGRIFVRPTSGEEIGEIPKAEEIEVFALGFEPEDFNAADLQDMKSKIRLVYGKPYIADCVAGLRTACPDEAELNKHVLKPKGGQTRAKSMYGNTVPVPDQNWVLQDVPAAEARRIYGVDGNFLRFIFRPGNKARFNAAYEGFRPNAENEHVYVVVPGQAGSFTTPRIEGKVLGSVALRANNQVVGFPVSSEQRTYLNDILKVNSEAATSACGLPKGTIGESDAYCIPGVPRNMFIPLENELTDDGSQFESSWKHYLRLAKEASTKADQLGDKLMDIGLQRDLRREKAAEELGDYCGTTPYVPGIKVIEGKTEGDPGDAPTQGCLDEKIIDVALLGPEPDVKLPTGAIVKLKDADAATRLNFLQNDVLQCDGKGATNPLCKKGELSYKALGIVGSDVSKQPKEDCGPVLKAVESWKSFSGDHNTSWLADKPYVRSDSASNLSSSLRMIETIDETTGIVRWKVLRDGDTIMSTYPIDGFTKWPRCTSSAMCEDKELAAQLSRLFDLPQSLTPAQIDSPQFRWRVEGAIWLIHAMAGSAPSGAFEVELPAVNFTNFQPNAQPLGERVVPTVAVYAQGWLQAAAPFAITASAGGTNAANAVFKPAHGLKRYQAYDSTSYAQLKRFNDMVDAELINKENSYVAISARSVSRTFDHANEAPALIQKILATFDHRAKILSSSPNFSDCSEPFLRHPGPSAIGLQTHPYGSFPEPALTTNDAFVERLVAPPSLRNVCPRTKSTKVAFFEPDGRGGFTSRLNFSYIDNSHLDRYRGTYSDMNVNNGPGGWVQAELGNYLPELGQIVEDPATTWGSESPQKYFAETHELPSSPTAKKTARNYMTRALSPEVCSPDERAQLFINSQGSAYPCDKVAQLTMGVGLACILSNNPPSANLGTPPPVGDPSDLPRLGAWVSTAGSKLKQLTAHLYVESMPKSALDSFESGSPNVPNISGKIGENRLDSAQALREIALAWQSVSDSLVRIGNHIATTKIQLDKEAVDAEKENISLEIQRLSQMQAIVSGSIRAIGGTISGIVSTTGENGNPAGWVNAGTSLAAGISDYSYESDKLDNLNELIALSAQGQALQTSLTLQILNNQITNEVSTLNKSVAEIIRATTAALKAGSQARALRTKSQYLASNVLGENYTKDEFGNLVPLTVNTVLNNQYDVTRRRYKEALKQAKYLAYIARLAIEQRIGARLDEVSFPDAVGPLEPPAEWADDICAVDGIDYAKYQEAPLPDWAKENAGAAGAAGSAGAGGGTGDASLFIHPDLFKDENLRVLTGLLRENGHIERKAIQYVGDYVQKLEEFVTYYNIEFPFRDGDDLEVLSLKDDLLSDTSLCQARTYNLLAFSEDLDRGTSADSETVGVSYRGWQRRACGDASAHCLELLPADALALSGGAATDALRKPPAAVPSAGVTWLRQVLNQSPPCDPTEQACEEVGAGSAPPIEPARSAYQRVYLAPGSYVFSWWDSARDADGAAPQPNDPIENANLVVLGENGVSAASHSFAPHRAVLGGSTENVWSERKRFGFEIQQAGVYVIGLLPGGSDLAPASVAFAGLQLELVAGLDAELQPYQPTTGSLYYSTNVCNGSDAPSLGESFTYKCNETNRCYYELNHPFVLNTAEIAKNGGYLNGDLAADNYNYRHESLALNLIGTGLMDCSKNPTTSCYANGTLEYTLEHTARDAPIRGWDDNSRCFDFGAASIRQGKALAAEKVITTPVGGSDNGLLSQPGITKTELKGRPLDGLYRLKIWDRPGLTFEKLEDVQFVLKYRYWSPVRSKPEGQ